MNFNEMKNYRCHSKLENTSKKQKKYAIFKDVVNKE